MEAEMARLMDDPETCSLIVKRVENEETDN